MEIESSSRDKVTKQIEKIIKKKNIAENIAEKTLKQKSSAFSYLILFSKFLSFV